MDNLITVIALYARISHPGCQQYDIRPRLGSCGTHSSAPFIHRGAGLSMPRVALPTGMCVPPQHCVGGGLRDGHVLCATVLEARHSMCR